MKPLYNLGVIEVDFAIEAEDSSITNKKICKNVHTFGLGYYASPDWRFDIAFTYGNAENFLQAKCFENGNTAIMGRGIFEKAHKISVLIKYIQAHEARFVIILKDKTGGPVFQDRAIGFDINPFEKNSHGTRFEMRFTAANHKQHKFGTGFAVSEPGEDDSGVAFFLPKKRSIIILDEAIRKAQRLHGNRNIVTALKNVLFESGLETSEVNHDF